MASEKKPLLGYWALRGLAEPIRSVLHYGGIDFDEKRYEWRSDVTTNLSEAMKPWITDKTENPLFRDEFDFTNLPYWIEGDLKLTQSLAILRYVAKKANLMLDNPTPQEQARLEMAEQQAYDFRRNLGEYGYGSTLFKLKYPSYVESISSQLKPWAKFLNGKKWLMGNKLTYVDFLFYEGLDWHKLLKDDCLDEYPTLKEFYQRFKDEPKIKAYHESDRYIHWPLLSAFAKVFGYYKE